MGRPSETRVEQGWTEKRCTKCLTWKPADDAHYSRFRDGVLKLHPWCRDCYRDYTREKAARAGKRVRKMLSPVGSLPRKLGSLPPPVLDRLAEITSGVDDEGARYKAYLIKNEVTGEHYVGITIRKLKDRWKQHLVGGAKGDGYLLHKAMHCDGIDNFSFTFVACAVDQKSLNALEVQLVEQYHSVEHGYNQTRGGAAGESVGIELKIDGRPFISISSAARSHGIDPANVHNRLRAGWPIEQAIGIVPPPQRKGRIYPYEVLGRTFDSFKAACEHYEIAEHVVRQRLKKGLPIEQAFGISPVSKPRRVSGKPIEVGGQPFSSIAEAARHFGVKSHTAAKRLKEGWSIGQAFGLESREPVRWDGQEVVVGGNTYASITQAAEAFGLDMKTVSARLRSGRSSEEALELRGDLERRPGGPSVAVTVGGKTYRSQAEAARAFGLNPKLVHKRITQFGWTLEQAFGEVRPPPRTANTAVEVAIGGQTYKSIGDACAALGIAHSTFNRRVKAGMSIHDALSRPSRRALGEAERLGAK